jgi:glutathione S-transferase
VVFTGRRRQDASAGDDGYDEMAVRMEHLVRQQPGFRDMLSVRGADGVGVTVATFDSEGDAVAWKQHPEHLEAQRLGRERFYEWYELQVTEVTRSYGWQRAARIFHIALPDDWETAMQTGAYTTSTRGRSLADEGFIHCSFGDQVEPTANRYYADLDELVLLTVDPSLLGSELIIEDPFPGAPQRFPHVYAPIPVAAVVETRVWHRRQGESWVVP